MKIQHKRSPYTRGILENWGKKSILKRRSKENIKY